MADVKWEFKDNSAKAKSASMAGIYKSLDRCGRSARDHAKTNIFQKGIYDTGRLYSTFGYQVNIGAKVVYVGTPTKYGIFQELGTTRIAARPYLKPALENNIIEYQSIIASELGSEFGAVYGGLSYTGKYYTSDTRVSNV